MAPILKNTSSKQSCALESNFPGLDVRKLKLENVSNWPTPTAHMAVLEPESA